MATAHDVDRLLDLPGVAAPDGSLKSSGAQPWLFAISASHTPIAPLPVIPPCLDAATSRPTRGSSRRILIIDDQATHSDPLRLILELEGFQVDWVQSGIEGLRRARTGDYAVTILDLHLLDIPGLSVLARVRATDDRTPIIVITGFYLSEEYERRARALGISAFLHKPVFDDDLVLAVRAAMRTPSSSDSEDADRVQASPPRPTESSTQVPWDEDFGPDGRYPLGTNQLLSELLPDLYRRTQRSFSGESPQLVMDAVHEAVMEQLQHGGVSREFPRTALTYRLFRAAWRNIANLVRSERRRQLREQQFAKEEDPAVSAMGTEFPGNPGEHRARLLSLATNVPERRALQVWLEGGDIEEMARELGCSGVRSEDQRRAVNRFKDRIMKRALRISASTQ